MFPIDSFAKVRLIIFLIVRQFPVDRPILPMVADWQHSRQWCQWIEPAKKGMSCQTSKYESLMGIWKNGCFWSQFEKIYEEKKPSLKPGMWVSRPGLGLETDQDHFFEVIFFEVMWIFNGVFE